jgi:hypothetical protein
MEFDNLLDEFNENPEATPKSSHSNSSSKKKKSKKPKKPKTSKPGESSFEEYDEFEVRPHTSKPKKHTEESSIDIYKLDSESSYHSPRTRSKSPLNPSEDPVISSLEIEIKDIKKFTEKQLEKEKSKILLKNQKILTNIKKEYQETIELTRKLYDDQLLELQNVKNSFEKIQTISDNLGFSTNLLDGISQELVRNKEDMELHKALKYEKQEKDLNEREKSIFDREQKLERELLDVQENLDSFKKQENEMREYYELEKAKVRQEIQNVHSIYLVIKAEINEKKQETLKEAHKIKVMQDDLEKRREQVNKGVGSRLKELEDFEELLILKHEETLKMINIERRQLSEKRDKLEEKKRENLVFEEKLRQNTNIVENREIDINLAIDELLKNKNIIEIQRATLEAEMQNMHKLSLKLHAQSENISKSKEQLEAEFNLLSKQEEDVENMKNYSKNEMLNAKESSKSLEQQLRTFERMSLNLIQDLNPALT